MPNPEQPQTFGDALQQFNAEDNAFTQIITDLQALQRLQRGEVTGAIMQYAALNNPDLLEALGQAFSAIINGNASLEQVLSDYPELHNTHLPLQFSDKGEILIDQKSGLLYDRTNTPLLPNPQAQQPAHETLIIEDSPDDNSLEIIQQLYASHPIIETIFTDPQFQVEHEGKWYIPSYFIELLLVHKSIQTNPTARYQTYHLSLNKWMKNKEVLHTIPQYESNVKFLHLLDAASLLLFMHEKYQHNRAEYMLRTDTDEQTTDLKEALRKLESKKKSKT